MNGALKAFFAPLREISIPPAVIAFPGMTSAGEKEALFRLASQYYQGSGLIIDAGLFLGASTNAFASGLKSNPLALENIVGQGIRPIKAYEIAIWISAGFDKYLDNPIVKAALGDVLYEDGDNYFPT